MKRYRVSIVLSAAELMDMIPFLPDEFYVETIEMTKAHQLLIDNGFAKAEPTQHQIKKSDFRASMGIQ